MPAAKLFALWQPDQSQAQQPTPTERWHADYLGHYGLQGYRYRAKLALGTNTEYAIETVMPGHYPGRPAQHIHCLISAPGHKTLVTQL